MKGEIKFRVWDKARKRMLIPLACVLHFSADGLQGIEYRGGSSAIFLQKNHVEIMQFTGLTDKNGKEIYEGDIVKYTSKGIQKDVVYREGGCFKIRQSNTRCIRCLNYHLEKYQCEVIGSIHESPELLK